FEVGLRAGLLFNAGRERTKTNCIRLVHEMRLPLRTLGQRLVNRGLLDNVEQVFMFTDRELDLVCMWANGESVLPDYPDFSALARQREATYLSLFDLEPPFVTTGAPPPPSEWRHRGDGGNQHVAAGAVLTGIPGCPGVAVGRARVVIDPTDPRGLEPGDILVAPLTDPAWTPLFVPAAAVVVNVGAQITHAVIVSRELGLPCVVSVIDATRKIPDGALIEVDGTNGTVKVLDTKERQPA
ncbi:MAG TPA: PEP-utilizing enzyme, partial [Acidimicrobiales bacterium]